MRERVTAKHLFKAPFLQSIVYIYMLISLKLVLSGLFNLKLDKRIPGLIMELPQYMGYEQLG